MGVESLAEWRRWTEERSEAVAEVLRSRELLMVPAVLAHVPVFNDVVGKRVGA